MAERDKYKVEIRGIKLSDTLFKNSWPHYGNLDIDGSAWSHTLTLPEREQSRKRKDEPFDVTSLFKTRSRRAHNLNVRKHKTPPMHDKNEDKNSYVIGIFLCQKLQIEQIVDYHKKYELGSFLSTFYMICERLFPTDKEDDCAVI